MQFVLVSEYSCEDLQYVVQLVFEDGEYKFKPTKLAYKAISSQKEIKIEFKNSSFHSNDGTLKVDYEKVPSQIETLLNNLNRSLLNYIMNKPQEDEW